MPERPLRFSRCSSPENEQVGLHGDCGRDREKTVGRRLGRGDVLSVMALVAGVSRVPESARPGGTEFLFLLVAVSFDVVLGGFGGMMRRVSLMSLSDVRVMGCCFVVAFLVVTGSFAMVVGRFVMMLGSLGMMMRRFLRHSGFPFAWIVPDYGTASSTNIVRRRRLRYGCAAMNYW